MNKFLTLAAAATMVLGFATAAQAGGYWGNSDPSIDVNIGHRGFSVEVDNYDYVNVNVGDTDASTTVLIKKNLDGDVTVDTTGVGANFDIDASCDCGGDINALNVNVGDVYASTDVTVRKDVGQKGSIGVNTTAIGANMTLDFSKTRRGGGYGGYGEDN